MMMMHIAVEQVSSTLFKFIDETFSKTHGLYLDKGTSLYATLDSVTAEEASRSASPATATIAAQVEHVRFYLDVINEMVNTKNFNKKYNWREIWETVGEVTPQEWDDLKRRLSESHARVMESVSLLEGWDGPFDIGATVSIIAHTAYHLGGIRQALAVIRASSQTSATAR